MIGKTLWKIGGEAGLGIMTSGLTFSKLASRCGYQLFDYIQYPSLIRGGHNGFESIFSEEIVHSLKKEIDYLVCLNKQTYELNKSRLTSTSYILYDEQEFKVEGPEIKISIPFKKILYDLKGEGVMKNIIALGASVALLQADLQTFFDIISDQFARKGKEIIVFNQRFAQIGYDYVLQNYADKTKPLLIKKTQIPQQLVLTGNDAFALGSIIADCRFYASYPMTPSSSVLTTLASWQEKTGMLVRHPEDEISVINTALGTSFAGVRSAVGTSGGGFALMVETVSLAGVSEIPIVIFLSQRPGPATGMPTWTEQADLLFAVNAGHGEFPKIVLAPGDVMEMIELTAKAFNLADIYQTPVIILSDMALSEAHKSLREAELNKLIAEYKVDRGKIRANPTAKNYLRYSLSSDGISEMLIPGLRNYYYQANSYEHLEDGHTTEEAAARTAQVDKRNKKKETYLHQHFLGPKIYGDFNRAETIFVSWGSTKGPILEAMNMLKEQATESAFIHFTHLFPLLTGEIKPHFTAKKRFILIENNSQAQFGKLLQQEAGIDLSERLLKYDGRPFSPEEIAQKVI